MSYKVNETKIDHIFFSSFLFLFITAKMSKRNLTDDMIERLLNDSEDLSSGDESDLDLEHIFLSLFYYKTL